MIIENALRLTSKLTKAEQKECGVGTSNTCLALVRGKKKIECSATKALQGDSNSIVFFDLTGIKLERRANIDPVDKKPQCPKGIFLSSKK